MRATRLCISLTPETLDEIFSSDLAGADMVEVRLDYLSNPQESIHSRWDRLPVPVIATCRGKERGGRFEGSIEDETRILEYAASNGAQFVDVDFRYARPFGSAQVIGSHHDFVETPPDLEALVDRACSSSAQIAKVATSVHSWSDNRRLLEAMAKPRSKPVIIAGMGEVGQITRILGPSRGSYLTYVSASNNKASAPGQVSLKEMLQV